MTRTATLALLLVGALLSLPLWVAPFPPMQDVAATTEAACQLLRVWRGEPAFTSVLEVHPQPWANSLPLVVLAALLGVSPSLSMAKLLLTVALIGWMAAVGWMLARFERSPWLALLAAPLAFDLAWSYGFFQFILAKPLVPVAVGLARTHATAPTAGRAFSVVAVLALTFVVHSLVWIVASACVGIVFLVHARRLRDAAALALPLSAALVTVPFFLATRGAASPGFVTKWRNPGEALMALWGDLGDQHPGAGDGLAWVLLVVALGVLAWRERGSLADASRARLALAACGVLLAVAWLVGPPVLPQVSVVSPRLASLAVLFLGAACVPADLGARTRSFITATMACACVAHVVDLGGSYRRFSTEEMGDFHALLAAIPTGARVATHTPSPFSRHARHNALWHWGKLGCLTRASFTDDLFAYRKTAYVEVRPERARDFITPPHRRRPDALQRFDALLVRGDARTLRSVAPLLEETAHTGTWRLFHVVRAPPGKPEPDPAPGPPR